MADFSVNTLRVNNSGGRTLLENWVEEVSKVLEMFLILFLIVLSQVFKHF